MHSFSLSLLPCSFSFSSCLLTVITVSEFLITVYQCIIIVSVYSLTIRTEMNNPVVLSLHISIEELILLAALFVYLVSQVSFSFLYLLACLLCCYWRSFSLFCFTLLPCSTLTFFLFSTTTLSFVSFRARARACTRSFFPFFLHRVQINLNINYILEEIYIKKTKHRQSLFALIDMHYVRTKLV